MPQMKRRLLGLGLPCLLALAFDIALTLYNQPSEYWAGDYSRTVEGNPFFRKLFEIQPLAAIAGFALWAGIILTWIALMPEVVAVILAVAVVFGHTAGGYVGMGFGIGPRWFQTIHGILFLSATVLGAGVHWSWRGARPNFVEAAGPGLHPAARWGLLFAASAVACYMYLIPQ